MDYIESFLGRLELNFESAKKPVMFAIVTNKTNVGLTLGGLLVVLTMLGCSPFEPTDQSNQPSRHQGTKVSQSPINENCPRSGRPVSPDSLTDYRGKIVGFCNPGCRDDFEKNPEAYPEDRAFFDKLIDP